jgi:cell division protease FtsH
MQEMLIHLDHVHIISIIPTGAAGGYTSWIPAEASDYKTKSYFEQQIISCMGGRAAEQLIVGDISTGASGDINQATNMARNMVTRYGMSDLIGPIQYGDSSQEVFIGRDMAQARNYSEDIAKTIDEEIKRIIKTAYDESLRILGENMDVLHTTAELLLEKEKITGAEFRKLFTTELPKKINVVNEATAKELGLIADETDPPDDGDYDEYIDAISNDKE